MVSVPESVKLTKAQRRRLGVVGAGMAYTLTRAQLQELADMGLATTIHRPGLSRLLPAGREALAASQERQK